MLISRGARRLVYRRPSASLICKGAFPSGSLCPWLVREPWLEHDDVTRGVQGTLCRRVLQSFNTPNTSNRPVWAKTSEDFTKKAIRKRGASESQSILGK